MIKDFFNGKYGLAKTYWWGVFGVGMLTRIMYRAINYGYLTIEDDAAYSQLGTFHTVITVILAIYMVLVVRALVKAGFDDRTPGGWGWVGIILTGLGTLYTVFTAITLLFPNIATPKILVNFEVQQINKQLPQDMGNGTTMTRVDMVGSDLIYYMRINLSVDEVDRASVENAVGIDTVDGQILCKQIAGYFKGGVENIVYEFSYFDGTLRAVLPKDDCMNWLRR